MLSRRKFIQIQKCPFNIRYNTSSLEDPYKILAYNIDILSYCVFDLELRARATHFAVTYIDTYIFDALTQTKYKRGRYRVPEIITGCRELVEGVFLV